MLDNFENSFQAIAAPMAIGGRINRIIVLCLHSPHSACLERRRIGSLENTNHPSNLQQQGPLRKAIVMEKPGFATPYSTLSGLDNIS